MPRVAAGPWATRTITVDGFGSSLPFALGMSGTLNQIQYIGGPGSRPWGTSAGREYAWNLAINTSSPSNTVGTTRTFTAGSDGAAARTSTAALPVGVVTRTHTDRQLFGTYLDGFIVQAYQALASVSVGQWLAILLDGPVDPSDSQALSLTEFTALFGTIPGSGWFREFSIPDCTVTLHVTMAVSNGLTGSLGGTVQRLHDTTTTEGVSWLTPAQLAGLAVDDSAASGTMTIDLPVELTGAQQFFTSVPVPARLYDYDLTSGSWLLNSAPVNRAGPGSTDWTSHFDIPEWVLDFDPGYDGEATPVDGTNQFGGPGASRLASLVMSMSATVTVRQRFAHTVYGTPPLHQTGRPGVLDATEGYQSQLVTPQSSPIQSGML